MSEIQKVREYNYANNLDNVVISNPTEEDMINEFTFMLADSLISKLENENLLNTEEAKRVKQECRKILIPEIASLYD